MNTDLIIRKDENGIPFLITFNAHSGAVINAVPLSETDLDAR